ncbi:MAG: VanZ family protein [Ruminococcaceae bacterium]|nr:VanZ family protein [Oscillospiraceae bacterium]
MRIKTNIKNQIFVLFYVFSLFSMHSDNLGSYWGLNGTPFIFFRFILIIALMLIAVIINKSDTAFIEKIVPPSALIITVFVVYDYFVSHISGSHFLYRVWWIAYIIVTLMVVFFTDTLFSKEDYPDFYRRFWRSFTPLYLFVFAICFLRMPGEEYSLNTELGNGTFLMLKALIHNSRVSFEAPLMFFGNIIIFTPLPFILSAISNKFTPSLIMIIGFLTPFAVESYQLVFKCGQVDIDDIVLNFGGFIIAFVFYLIIYKQKNYSQYFH